MGICCGKGGGTNVSYGTQINNLIPLSDADIPKYTLNGLECPAKCVDVYDGDTCRMCFYVEGKIRKYTVRLEGYDAPEKRGKKVSIYEKAMAIKARRRLMELLKVNNTIYPIVYIKCGKWDKYGRLLATIYTDIDTIAKATPRGKMKERTQGISVNQCMLDTGYCYKYSGGKKEKIDYSTMISLDEAQRILIAEGYSKIEKMEEAEEETEEE